MPDCGGNLGLSFCEVFSKSKTGRVIGFTTVSKLYSTLSWYKDFIFFNINLFTVPSDCSIHKNENQIDLLKRKYDSIDVVISYAGFFLSSKFRKTNHKVVQKITDINFYVLSKIIFLFGYKALLIKMRLLAFYFKKLISMSSNFCKANSKKNLDITSGKKFLDINFKNYILIKNHEEVLYE